MKKILRLLLALLIGSGIGLLIGGLAFVVFGGGSFSEFFERLIDVDVMELIELVGLMILWMVVSAVVQIVIHEGGHLVAGLLTGYRFVSFRIFSLTLIEKDGHYQFRRFSLGGTGGQCLMAPPDRPVEEINTRWYNLGGVLANLVVSVAALLAFLQCDLPMWADTWMLMMAVIGFFYAILNGWPMKVGGIGNDGHNLLHLEKSPTDKKLLCQMLQTNACIQNGAQPKDLPEDFFVADAPIDWGDGIQVNWQMMVVARLENLRQWDEAYRLLGEAVGAKSVMPRIFWMETVCEMIFVCLATGRVNEARKLYSPDLKKYVGDYAATQSSKQRIAFAIALVMEGKKVDAHRILEKLKAERQQYLLQGEVDMDIELMEWLS